MTEIHQLDWLCWAMFNQTGRIVLLRYSATTAHIILFQSRLKTGATTGDHIKLY